MNLFHIRAAMKPFVVVLMLALVSLQSSSPPPGALQDAWAEAAVYELPQSLTSPYSSEGIPGAGAISFRIGKHSCGAIIDRLDQRGIGVFVSVGLDMTALDTPVDIRLEFTDQKGDRHLADAYASAAGGSCLLFCTKELAPTSELVQVRVLYNPNAKWIRE